MGAAVLRQVQRGVVAVTDTKQQDPGIELVEAGQRRALTETISQLMILHDGVRVRAYGGKRHRRMAAATNTGHVTEALDDRSHHPGLRELGMERRGLVADGLPPS